MYVTFFLGLTFFCFTLQKIVTFERVTLMTWLERKKSSWAPVVPVFIFQWTSAIFSFTIFSIKTFSYSWKISWRQGASRVTRWETRDKLIVVTTFLSLLVCLCPGWKTRRKSLNSSNFSKKICIVRQHHRQHTYHSKKEM